MNTLDGSSKLAHSILELIEKYENEIYAKGFKDGKESNQNEANTCND